MKKLISMLLVSVMALTLVTGCTKGGATAQAGGPDKLSVVTTIFPEYDWVNEITRGNDNVEITMLLDKGVDLHSFQPTADDIVKVACCDVFVYVGGESDEWVEDALDEAVNKNMIVINLMEVLGDAVKEEEFVEGMQEEDEHDEQDEDGHDSHDENDESEHEHHHEEGEIEYDEHVWLSLKNAKLICQYIADKLSEADASNSELYAKNVSTYIESLDALDKEYEEAVNSASVKTILFGDRFPFRYMVDDYGIKYYAAFVGCSAESEASFETITFLAGKVDELKLNAICQIESANGKIADTIKSNTATKDQEVLTFNSLQSVTAKEAQDGTKYIDVMRDNLDTLKKALGCGK